MIVVCPSCRQRYRHDIPVATPPPQAHCSSCDERFELEPPKRSYVLAGVMCSPGPTSSIEIELPNVDATTHYPGDLAPEPVLRPAAFEAAVGELDEAASASAESETRRQGRVVTTHGAVLESLVALVPCGVGAAMAYYFAGRLSQDPITWAALGGAVGLLLGWACLLWITRGD